MLVIITKFRFFELNNSKSKEPSLLETQSNYIENISTADTFRILNFSLKTINEFNIEVIETVEY